MTGIFCSVASCQNNSKKAKKDGEHVRFFSFPKKKVIAKEWIRFCRRKDDFNPKNKKICSKHFSLDQYDDMIKAQLMNVQPKRLKETAIPSLYLSLQSENIMTERRNIKERKKMVADILVKKENLPPSNTDLPATYVEVHLDELPTKKLDTHVLVKNENLSPTNTDLPAIYVEVNLDELPTNKLDANILVKNENLSPSNTDLPATDEVNLDELPTNKLNANILVKNENLPPSNPDLPATDVEVNLRELSSNQPTPYEMLFKRYSALEKVNENLQCQIQKNKTDIQTLLEKNKKLEANVADSEKKINIRVREMLAHVLSPKQIDIILKKKTKARWTNEEICKALTLRYFSKRAYIYLRQSLKYPLPGVSTLQRWASSMNLQHGILKDVLKANVNTL